MKSGVEVSAALQRDFTVSPFDPRIVVVRKLWLGRGSENAVPPRVAGQHLAVERFIYVKAS